MKKRITPRAIVAFAILLCLLLGSFGATSAYALERIKEPDIIVAPKYPAIKEDILGGSSILDKIPGIELPQIKPIEPEAPLPEAYCLRDDYIVYAQHQDKNGYCWNFASTMAAATTIMKATNEYYDFSELWTGITCYTPGKQYSQVGGGGSFSMQYKAMQRYGLMLESDLPYQYSYTVSNENAADYYDFFNQYANDDLSSSLVYTSDLSYDQDDVESIKRHLVKNGSLYLSFSFKQGFTEENGVYSLPPNQSGAGSYSHHAISLIGWDDNYEREFYLDGSDTPTVFKGAWLVLNSYTETSGTDGISRIFYEDTNISDIRGYQYQKDTKKSFYFYDKIESGYEYPTNVAGKYYGDYEAKTAATKQLNIFYDDVDLTYSYEISSGSKINSIEIYLNNTDVTSLFDIRIDEAEKKFYISRDNVDYGNYKILVKYGNASTSDTYLNNFYVTRGLLGEILEIDYEQSSPEFSAGKILEYMSYGVSDKEYIFYTSNLKGSIAFLPTQQSVYSEINMSIPTIAYEITDGEQTTVTHTLVTDAGYELTYRFTFIYTPDASMQPVIVYYDLDGGTNHDENYLRELGNEAAGLTLYAPSRAGYAFAGWYIETDDGYTVVESKDGISTVNWSDINHMGDAPAIYALSFYKRYYKNSSVLFVRALWEKADYTAIWKNWNGDTLLEDGYFFDQSPIYNGIAPTRPEDARYTYSFAGWLPTESSGGTVTYQAIFNAIPKQFRVTVESGIGGAVISNGSDTVTCLDSITYTFVPERGYKIKDIKVDGVSIGTPASYTITDATSDIHISAEFEKSIDIDVIVIIALCAMTLLGTALLVYVIIRMRKMELILKKLSVGGCDNGKSDTDAAIDESPTLGASEDVDNRDQSAIAEDEAAIREPDVEGELTEDASEEIIPESVPEARDESAEEISSGAESDAKPDEDGGDR